MLYESEAIQQIGLISSEDVQYLFLPLAHVFAKVLEVTWLRTGHTMAFWERDMKKIVENLAEVRPTVVCGPGLHNPSGPIRPVRWFPVGLRGRTMNIIHVANVCETVERLPAVVSLADEQRSLEERLRQRRESE